MRVSERQRYKVTEQRVETAKNNNANMLEKLSTQKDINRISDDPVAAIRMTKLRGDLKNIDQFRKNIDFSKGFLDRTESSVTSMSDKLIRAKELAIAMSNDTYDQTSREATAREVKEIINEMVQLANTKYSGRYIFSGFRNQTPTLSPDGTFLGDDGAIYLQIDNNTYKQINLPARDLFQASQSEAQAGHYDLLATLDMLHEGMMNNDKNLLHTATEELGHQQEKMTSYQATIGGMWNALNQTAERLDLDSDLTKGTLSKIEDVDFYKAAQDFKLTETVLQSTLMASNKLMQPSLLNFLQ